MKLIDKSTVVAEIKKRIKETESMQPKFDQFWAGQISAFKGVLKILDTLEEKEADLEKELSILDNTLFDLDGVAVAGTTHYLTVEDVKYIAKHFFELGLNSQTKDMIEALRTEYEKGRHDIIEKTLKWLLDLNQEHEIMSYTDSHVLSSEELQQYYKNIIEQ